jgi:large exoprotein involved in heme utilization and adhesion
LARSCDGEYRAGIIRIELGGALVNVGDISAATVDGPGAGGSISIRAHSIDLSNGSNISATTFGSGNAGTIALSATDITIRSRSAVGEGVLSNTSGSGHAGAIEIAARRLSLLEGGTISTTAFAGGSGDAGSITVAASESIALRGRDRHGFPSLVRSTSFGEGRGGSVQLSAPAIVLDEGLVQARASGAGAAGSIVVRSGALDLLAGGRLDASVEGAGAGGRIDAIAGRVSMRGVEASGPFPEYVSAATPSGIFSSTAGPGAGGNIRIEAARVELSEGAQVSASSEGTGLAGSIAIVAIDRLSMNQGTIRTDARTSDGGNVTIEAGNRVHLAGSEISTSVGSGAGSGGNIAIDPTFVILQDSRIMANAFGGAGGNISVVADYFLLSPDSSLEASSRLGVPGSVRVEAIRTDASSQLRVLPAQFLDASGLLNEACGGRWQPGSSRLVDVGRGGIAQSPFGYAGSTYFPPGADFASAAAGRTLAAPARGDGEDRIRVHAAPGRSVHLAGICGS